MKNLICALTLLNLMPLALMANPSQLQTAKSVEGYSAFSGQAATSCTFSVEQGESLTGESQIVLFLNSDDQTFINNAIRLNASQIPLQEGVLVSRNGLEITYENGILKQLERETNEGPLVKDYKIMELEVGPNLEKIRRGYTKATTAGLFSEKVISEMTCSF
jgi:hypothetical protein